ncbi:MAG: SIMPL domain-containing protein [Clostridia bacterium]|nr:SIMPL domain-containing protein [Clostridia bacterium]
MKGKRIALSAVIIMLVCLLVVGGVSSAYRKRPIEVKEFSNAQVIEYESEEEILETAEEETKEVGGEIIEGEEESLPNVKTDLSEQINKVSICVYGNSKVSLSPDRAKISARIETLDGEMAKAKEANFATFDKVIAALKEIGIEEEQIVLKHFNCHPNYDYDYGRNIIGYYSTITFDVKLDGLDKVKECASVLTENGVTNISDVIYEVSNLDEEYNNALMAAVENSKEKAAKVLGRNDLKIVSVKEEYVYSCNSLYRNYMDDMSASDLIGKLEIEARVLVEFN